MATVRRCDSNSFAVGFVALAALCSGAGCDRSSPPAQKLITSSAPNEADKTADLPVCPYSPVVEVWEMPANKPIVYYAVIIPPERVKIPPEHAIDAVDIVPAKGRSGGASAGHYLAPRLQRRHTVGTKS